MKAMLFAAGLGTRLFPITKDKPKALAPFLGDTLIAYNLRFLAKQGVTEFVINTHHFAEKIVQYLAQNNNFGLNIHLSHEEELLDTAGGLANAASYFETDEDIILFNVDVISNINIQQLWQWHQSHKATATLAVRKRETSRYLRFDKQMRLCGWVNKTTGDSIGFMDDLESIQELAFSGIQIINMKLLHDMPVKKMSIIPLYLSKAKDNAIMGFQHDSDYWFDCGKVESLEIAATFVQQNPLK